MTEIRRADLHGSLSDPLLDTMTFLNEVTSRYPDAVSFAPGRPYEGFFEPEGIHEYLDAYTGYLREERGFTDDDLRTVLFQYGRTKGIIHELVARTLANDEEIAVSPEALVVTVGAQEGMLLVLRALFADERDVLLVSSPCYIGITGAARLLDIEIAAVPEECDPKTIADIVDDLAARGKRARALYVVPDFANPTGTSMPVEARQRLLDVADERGFLVIEDNPYGFFAVDDRRRPTLKSLDERGRVVYLGSFAKTCLPGARVGYVIADQEVVAADGGRSLLADELAKIKSMTTVNTPALAQAVIGGMLVRHGCRLRDANARSIAFYARNLRTLLADLDSCLPPATRAALGVEWNTPDGGFFVQMSVPFVADDAALERCARQYGVLWAPMGGFYPDGGGEHRLRLSCSYLDPEQITAGVRRLVAFITDEAQAFVSGSAGRTAEPTS